jgi:uncharacterized protein YbcV (DUF1398 family)
MDRENYEIIQKIAREKTAREIKFGNFCSRNKTIE